MSDSQNCLNPKIALIDTNKLNVWGIFIQFFGEDSEAQHKINGKKRKAEENSHDFKASIVEQLCWDRSNTWSFLSVTLQI